MLGLQVIEQIETIKQDGVVKVLGTAVRLLLHQVVAVVQEALEALEVLEVPVVLAV